MSTYLIEFGPMFGYPYDLVVRFQGEQLTLLCFQVFSLVTISSKKNLTVMYHQSDHVDSLTKTAWGMLPIGYFRWSAKVPKLV